LEERLGVVLIERRMTGAELTPVGREIAARARSVLVDVRDIRDLARRAAAGMAGVVRFGVTPTLGPYLMPEIVARLHREQPDLKLHIREGIPDAQALELARGQLDMLLGPLPIEGEGLAVEPLFRERLILVAAPDHPLAVQAGELSRDQLRGVEILSLDPRHHLYRKVVSICADYGMAMLQDYEGTSLDSIRQMVGSGLGLAILPEFYIGSEVGGNAGVKLLSVAGWNETRSIAAAWRAGAAYADAYHEIAERIQGAARRLAGDS